MAHQLLNVCSCIPGGSDFTVLIIHYLLCWHNQKCWTAEIYVYVLLINHFHFLTERNSSFENACVQKELKANLCSNDIIVISHFYSANITIFWLHSPLLHSNLFWHTLHYEYNPITLKIMSIFWHNKVLFILSIFWFLASNDYFLYFIIFYVALCFQGITKLYFYFQYLRLYLLFVIPMKTTFPSLTYPSPQSMLDEIFMLSESWYHHFCSMIAPIQCSSSFSDL